MRDVLKSQPNLQIKQAEVAELLIEELAPAEVEPAPATSPGLRARLS